MMEEKFKANLSDIKKQFQNPKTIRGMTVDNLMPEKIAQEKNEQIKKMKTINKIAVCLVIVYMMFWSLLYLMLAPFAEQIAKIGVGLLSIIIILIMLLIQAGLKRLSLNVPLLSNQAVPMTLLIYPLFCMIICLLALNNIPLELFMLAK